MAAPYVQRYTLYVHSAGSDASALRSVAAHQQCRDGTFAAAVCTQYEIGGKRVDEFPFPAALAEAKPVMEYLPGWGCDISNARKFGDLPAAARDYVRYVEDTLRTPIPYVSVGAARDAIILR